MRTPLLLEGVMDDAPRARDHARERVRFLEGEMFLKRWNKLARRYGYRQVRVLSPKLFHKVAAAIDEIGQGGMRDYWWNVGATMRSYAGEEFMRYFTLEYIVRPDRRAQLMDDELDHVPHRPDPKYLKKTLAAMRAALVEKPDGPMRECYERLNEADGTRTGVASGFVFRA